MTTMHVRETGMPGRPAIVFLHGAGASGGIVCDHMARLDDRFHCLAPVLPGFGRSKRIPFQPRAETAALVAQLIEARVPADKAHLAGLSWGGALVHTLLGTRPELADRVVIDGSGPAGSGSRHGPWRRPPDRCGGSDVP
jgi:pimeloyl-ACP methyl ester carboxylesterase